MPSPATAQASLKPHVERLLPDEPVRLRSSQPDATVSSNPLTAPSKQPVAIWAPIQTR